MRSSHLYTRNQVLPFEKIKEWGKFKTEKGGTEWPRCHDEFLTSKRRK